MGEGPKGEKGGKAASDASGDPSLQSKGRTEQQARSSRRPRPMTTPREAAQAAQAAGDGGGAREKAEILRLEAENKLLREQLKAAEAARKTAQDALTGERALWQRRGKGWEKQRGELQQQVTATAQVPAVGEGGEDPGSADPDHVLYLHAAAVELHSELSAKRHVAINMGVKEATLTELKRLLDKHPVAHLLDPKRRRAEESEGSQSQGSKWSKK